MAPEVASRTKRTFLIVFTIWTIMVWVAPLSLPTDSVPDISGRSGSIDNLEQVEEMNPFAALVYLAGDAYCHQKAERSLYVNGNEMPFCARDVGIFCGLAIGMAMVLLFRPGFNLIVLVALVLPIVLDGGVQMIGYYESSNAVRLSTGLMGGIGCSYLLGHVTDMALSTQRSNRVKKGDL